MNHQKPSELQAKDALDSLYDSQQTLLNDSIPSVWIRLTMSLSFGAILFGYGMTEHENNWALAIWVGALGFVLSSALYIYSYRLRGIRIRFFPRSSKSENTNVYAGIAFAGLSFSSRLLRTELGLDFGPYLCSIVAVVLFFWLQRKFPTGEVGVGRS